MYFAYFSGTIGITPHITNQVDLSSANKSLEIGMRIKTEWNDAELFTDLNGLRTVQRPVFKSDDRINNNRNSNNKNHDSDSSSNMPIQGHIFPATAYAFIQNQIERVSLISSQPQGVASLQSGERGIFLNVICGCNYVVCCITFCLCTSYSILSVVSLGHFYVSFAR